MFRLQHFDWSLKIIVVVCLLDDVLLGICFDQMVRCVCNLLVLEGKRLVLGILRISDLKVLFYLRGYGGLLIGLVDGVAHVGGLVWFWDRVIGVCARAFVFNVGVLSCHYRAHLVDVRTLDHLGGLSRGVNGCVDVAN